MTETPHLATDIDQGGFCNALVMREGFGATCGLRADDPIHLIPEHAEYDTNPEATKLVEDWAARKGLEVGDQVTKPRGYPFPGEVRAIFLTQAGETRLVVENAIAPGLLHIFSPTQVQPAPEPEG